MKKTLAALSVLGAFAGSALAADVTLYGVIDTGLVFQHADADMQGVDTVDTFQMKSGVTAGSRFGLKGTEDLGNGLKIGFVLENGFSSDTGSFTQDNRLFGREAQLNLSGAFGTVAFGRMGSLASGNGTFGLLGSMSPFGTSWGQADAGVLRLCAYEQFIERHPEAVGELRILDRRDTMWTWLVCTPRTFIRASPWP